MQQKLCVTCKAEKPLSEFHRNKNKKDGLSPTCKECAIVRAKAWYSEHLEQQKEYNKRRYQENIDEERAKRRDYRSRNIEQERERSRKWRTENRERLLQNKRERYASDKEYRELVSQKGRERRQNNAEKVKETQRRYRDENRAKLRESSYRWRTQNRDAINERKRMAYHLNPDADAIRASSMMRRALGKVSAEIIKEIYAEQNGCCAYCGIEVGQKYDVDHIHPVSKGGTNARKNLCIACPPCNRSKHNKSIEEWQAIRGW